VPVVMMSGFGVEVAPEELRSNGVDLVLAKPLQIRDVLNAVASMLGGRGPDPAKAGHP
jgi:DNA-binding response OmpR family regulator